MDDSIGSGKVFAVSIKLENSKQQENLGSRFETDVGGITIVQLPAAHFVLAQR